MIDRCRHLMMVCALGVVAGCATTQRLSAASDVHALLVAIRDDDKASFNAHVDRPALEAQLQARIVDRTRQSNAPAAWKGVGVVISGPLARAAGAVLVRPEVFRAVAKYYGYRLDAPIPNVLTLSAALRPLADGRVCATRGKHGPCLLTFAEEGGRWRLVGFDGEDTMLRPGGR